jgi:hypothetical protein
MASAASALTALTSDRPPAEALPRVPPLAPVPPPTPIPVPAPAPYLTAADAADAARYRGFNTPSAIRKAHMEARIFPVSRRGGKGTWVYAVADLDRFMRGEPPLPSAATASVPGTLRCASLRRSR